MRLLICGLNFAPELTGVGKYTGEMAAWLMAQGFEVRVVAAPPYYPEWQVASGHSAWRYRKERVAGIETYRCPLWVPKRVTGLKRLIHLASFGLSSLPVLLRLAFWRPHVVWVAEPTLFAAPGALLCAALCRARTWLHVQDLEVDAAFTLQLVPRRGLHRAALACERWLLRRFDRVSTISTPMVERLVAKGVPREKARLFPNWAHTGKPASDAEALAFRRQLGLREDVIVCLYSGNMGQKQGLTVLIEAARRLREERQIAFVLCGAGIARKSLQRSAAGLPNVCFLDLQPPDRLPALLRMADIHLLPQRADAANLVLPSKLTGMLASGRPSIAASGAGTHIAEILQGRGIVVPPEQSDPLVAAIKLLAGDPEHRARLAAAARAYAKQHLAPNSVLRRFADELQKLAA